MLADISVHRIRHTFVQEAADPCYICWNRVEYDEYQLEIPTLGISSSCRH